MLAQAVDLQKKKKVAKAKPKKTRREEEMDGTRTTSDSYNADNTKTHTTISYILIILIIASYFDDGLEIAEHELELLKKKKRWRLKEEELRYEYISFKY